MKCHSLNSLKHECRAKAMRDSEYCFYHNPLTKKKLRDAAQNGGRSSIYPESLLDAIDLNSVDDITQLIVDTINRVRLVREDGSMSIKTANCIGHLSGKLLELQRSNLAQIVGANSEQIVFLDMSSRQRYG